MRHAKRWSAPSATLSTVCARRPYARPTRRRPKQLAEPQLYDFALNSLTRRAQSIAELRQRLQRRAVEPAAVERVLTRLLDAGLLDDHRFALHYAAYRAGARRFGRYRIRRELRCKGLPEELIERALAEAFPEEKDEVALVRARLARRLRGKERPYSEKVLRSAYQSLLRAGFSSAIILRELERHRRASRTGKVLHELANSEPDAALADEQIKPHSGRNNQ